MISMTTVVILAGGKSSRMGQDKATMFGGVERIYQECIYAGIPRIITLCGREDRKQEFPGEVWADPPNSRNLVQIIQWVLTKLEGDVLLVPCDAFNLTKKGITQLTKLSDCIPLDERGIRQPLHAKICQRRLLNLEGRSINELFVNFPDVEISGLTSEFNNFNSREDLKNHHLQ